MPSILKGLMNLFHIEYADSAIIGYLDLIIKVIAILIIIKVIIKISYVVIEKFFKRQSKLRFGMNEKKANTLSELLKNILQYVLYFIAAFSIFETIWPNVNTTIALTSVVGVALGFGSQNLVKDVISGFFILFEDQFAVGDYIVIEGMSGVVEVVGLRITQIRDFSGDLHTIPNGNITKVTNKTRGNMRAMVEINISYEEDVDIAIEEIKRVVQKAKEEIDIIIEGPDVLGVTSFGENGVIIRIVAKTAPMQQWEVEFELRKRIKKAFDEKGIKLGYARKLVIDRGPGL
jgi:moderate conductance mechanosensitive channel